MPEKKQKGTRRPAQRGHLRPKSAEKDSYPYWLPHDIPYLIRELARVEGEELSVDDLPPADYLTRLIRTEAKRRLAPDVIEGAHQWADERKQERVAEAERKQREREQAQEERHVESVAS